MKVKLTAADWASFSRIIATPALLLLLTDMPHKYWITLGLVFFAIITDYLDGYWARKSNTASAFGAFLDFTADKIFVAALLIILSVIGLVPAWMTILIISREFLVMGIRMYAALEGFAIIARFWGKLKTATTFIAFIVLLLPFKLPIPYWSELTYILLLVVVLLTILSAVDYVVVARNYIAQKQQ